MKKKNKYSRSWGVHSIILQILLLLHSSIAIDLDLSSHAFFINFIQYLYSIHIFVVLGFMVLSIIVPMLLQIKFGEKK